MQGRVNFMSPRRLVLEHLAGAQAQPGRLDRAFGDGLARLISFGHGLPGKRNHELSCICVQLANPLFSRACENEPKRLENHSLVIPGTYVINANGLSCICVQLSMFPRGSKNKSLSTCPQGTCLVAHICNLAGIFQVPGIIRE